MRFCKKFARLAQWLEHLVYTEGVGGSSPSPRTASTTSEHGSKQTALLACGTRKDFRY